MGPEDPGGRDPLQGAKEEVRGRPSMGKAASPLYLLRCPIRLHLGDKFEIVLRIVKLGGSLVV